MMKPLNELAVMGARVRIQELEDELTELKRFLAGSQSRRSFGGRPAGKLPAAIKPVKTRRVSAETRAKLSANLAKARRAKAEKTLAADNAHVAVPAPEPEPEPMQPVFLQEEPTPPATVFSSDMKPKLRKKKFSAKH